MSEEKESVASSGRERFARRMMRRIAERRKLLVRGGIVAAVLLFFVILPSYMSLRPQFIERYEEFDGAYKTWSESVHAKVACQDCHVQPKAAARAVYGARMLGEFYLTMVAPGRQPDLFSEPTNAACSNCHIDLRTVSPSGDLNIPHRAHVSVLKLKCVDCHGFLVHEKSPEGKNKPPMSGCLKCHDGKTAKNECSACHTEKVEPLTHREATWIVEHPRKASEECNSCHKWTERWCSDCHTKRPRSHGSDWRAKHRVKVNEHRNCEACHKPEFCVECHGEVPKSNFDPALRLVVQ